MTERLPAADALVLVARLRAEGREILGVDYFLESGDGRYAGTLDCLDLSIDKAGQIPATAEEFVRMTAQPSSAFEVVWQ